MNIAIDLRSLSRGYISGVENYTLNLLDHLLAMDKKNHYILFYNAWHENVMGDFHYINSKVKKTSIPNKILNLGLKFKLLSLEKLIGPFDCLFMPNLNQFNISPNAKLALTVHDLSPIVTPEFYDLKRKLWHKFLNYKGAFARANIIFAVSEYTKTDLVRLFQVEEKKIKVVYPGIDQKHFKSDINPIKLREIRNVYGLPGNYILFLNTIEPRKNLVNLIKAFDLISNDINLVIAGKPGWKYKSIFKQVQKSRKFSKIKYIGYIEEADKPAIIAMSKALVYPSFYEGFGFQPLEAAACGVPAIVSQVSALPEILGDSALLVNPHDVNRLAAGIDAILSNEALSKKLVEKAKEKVKQFNWQNTAEKILAGLNNLT